MGPWAHGPGTSTTIQLLNKPSTTRHLLNKSKVIKQVLKCYTRIKRSYSNYYTRYRTHILEYSININSTIFCNIINTLTNLKVTKREAAAFDRRLLPCYAHVRYCCVFYNSFCNFFVQPVLLLYLMTNF